jgi:EpsI family protein
MPDPISTAGFFRGRAFWAVTAILALEIGVFYTAQTKEFVPSPPPLKVFSQTVDNWRMVAENELDAETQAFLKADDTLNRTYLDSSGESASLFVAFFKSQRAGVTPHSPKVCLPGNGWTPESSTRVGIDIPGEPPLRVNRFVVSRGEHRRGEHRSIVYYWYQTPYRVFADEYVSKAYLMLDGVRYRRSDEALIRVIVQAPRDGSSGDEVASRFIRSVFHPLKRQMWVNNEGRT